MITKEISFIMEKLAHQYNTIVKPIVKKQVFSFVTYIPVVPDKESI